MVRTVYDTRFFIEHYYSTDKTVLRKTTEEIRRTKEKCVSSLVIHEVYRLSLEKEGRETAMLRTTLIEQDFKVVNVDSRIAKTSAEIRHGYHMSMADSIIAATCQSLGAVCFTDDPHIKDAEGTRTKWF